MPDKPFAQAMRIELQSGPLTLATVEHARDVLMEDWPPERRGPRHRDALDACLKVLDGHRSIVDAETALRDAADEAGLKLVNELG